MMEKIRLWVWYFALGVSAVLAIITFYTGENFISVVLSAIIGFTLIYGISMLSIAIFEKTSIQVEAEDIGTVLDIAVGQEDNLDLADPILKQTTYSQNGQMPPAMAGQLNQEFTEGLPSAEKQAEMVRRMGWDD